MILPDFIHPVLWLLRLGGLSVGEVTAMSKVSRTARYYQGYNVPPDKEVIYRQILQDLRRRKQGHEQKYPPHQRQIYMAWRQTVDQYLDSPLAIGVTDHKLSKAARKAVDRMTKALLRSPTLTLTREELFASSRVSHVTFYKALQSLRLLRTRQGQRLLYSLPE